MQNIGPDFDSLLAYVWRRHLVAAVGRVETFAGSDADEQ